MKIKEYICAAGFIKILSQGNDIPSLFLWLFICLLKYIYSFHYFLLNTFPHKNVESTERGRRESDIVTFNNYS